MYDIERIQSGLQAIFNQLRGRMEGILSREEINQYNREFYEQQKKLNPLASSILVLKDGNFEIKKIDSALIINHLEDVARFIIDYHKAVRKKILGFPELDVETMTAAFKEDFSDIGFYELFKE